MIQTIVAISIFFELLFCFLFLYSILLTFLCDFVFYLFFGVCVFIFMGRSIFSLCATFVYFKLHWYTRVFNYEVNGFISYHRTADKADRLIIENNCVHSHCFQSFPYTRSVPSFVRIIISIDLCFDSNLIGSFFQVSNSKNFVVPAIATGWSSSLKC